MEASVNRSNQTRNPNVPDIDSDRGIAGVESVPARVSCVESDDVTPDSDVQRPAGRLPMRSTLFRQAGKRN